MDVNIRDWMVIIGVLLTLAVLLDGYRRMRGNSDKIRVALTKVPPAADSEEGLFNRHEFPNGGARVVERDDLASQTASQTAEPPILDSAEDQPFSQEFSAVDTPGEDNLDLISGVSGKDQEHSSAEQLPAGVEQEVVMMYVAARSENGFSGEDILHLLLACDMRFGEMNFFHRHEDAAGRGRVQFSVANMMQPGVFDIDAMSGFSTMGLIFFFTLPGPKNTMAAFESMLETAEYIAKNLDGDLLDESRSVATRQTQEHIRQRIRELERRLLAHNSSR